MESSRYIPQIEVPAEETNASLRKLLRESHEREAEMREALLAQVKADDAEFDDDRNIDYLMDRLAANATNPKIDADMRCLLAEARAVQEIESFLQDVGVSNIIKTRI